MNSDFPETYSSNFNFCELGCSNENIMKETGEFIPVGAQQSGVVIIFNVWLVCGVNLYEPSAWQCSVASIIEKSRLALKIPPSQLLRWRVLFLTHLDPCLNKNKIGIGWNMTQINRLSQQM